MVRFQCILNFGSFALPRPVKGQFSVVRLSDGVDMGFDNIFYVR